MTKWRGPDIDSVNVNYDCNYQSFRFKTRLDDLPKLCRFHHFLTTLFLTMKWSPQILLLRCLHVRTKWMLMVMHPLTSVAFLTSCNMNFFPRFPGPSWCLVDTFFPEIIMITLILWVFIFVCHPFVATIDCYRFPLNDK